MSKILKSGWQDWACSYQESPRPKTGGTKHLQEIYLMPSVSRAFSKAPSRPVLKRANK